MIAQDLGSTTGVTEVVGVDMPGRNIRNTILRMERTIHSQVIPEAEVDQWVEEAETGYDVDALKTRMGRPARGALPSQVVPVRLTTEELAAVMVRAEREHLNRSEAFRAALSAWAHAEHPCEDH